MSGGRVTGKVRWFNADKGYGFLQPDDGGDEVFVHKTDLARSLFTLATGQQVSYVLVDTSKGTGKKAANVELV